MISRYININNDYSYIFLGPRQTGKSTYLESIGNEKTWEINLLEQRTYLKYSHNPTLFQKEAHYQIQKKRIDRIWIDEIQKLPFLLDEVQLLIDQTDCKVFLSGSSARKLKRGSANLLGGRALMRRLYPFIYQEIESLFNLEETLQYGLLPSIFQKKIPQKKDLLRAYVETYLKEEIQNEGLVRGLGGFSRFLEVAAQSCAEPLNYSKIARDCNYPPKTVQNYFEILEDTLIGTRLYVWNKSVRKQLSHHPKFYFFDTGVSNALLHRLHDPLDPSLRGRGFEQWLFHEIRARIDYDQKDLQLYYWRTQAGVEVDLLIARGSQLLAALEFKSHETLNSEHFRGLNTFHEEHPDIPRYLVFTGNNPYLEEGAQVIPWELFLTQELLKIGK